MKILWDECAWEEYLAHTYSNQKHYKNHFIFKEISILNIIKTKITNDFFACFSYSKLAIIIL